jgi:Flp pilus assembly protein TadB
VSGTLSRCRACGRDTTTTDDWRCTYCGQPKPLTAEPVATETLEDPPEPAAGHAQPGVWEDLRPQLAAAALAGLIAVVGLLTGSALLLIAAAAVLVVAVVAKIRTDGW